MVQVSAFILELAKTLAADLRESVAPDKLQFEVEKELEKQVLAGLVRAISEYSYERDETGRKIKRKAVLRQMGYCSEMWIGIGLVKGNLAPGEVGSQFTEEIFL